MTMTARTSYRLWISVFLAVLAVTATGLSQTYFENVTASVGITGSHLRSNMVCAPNLGSGSAWADYDNDGDPDLYLTNQGGANYLYRNDGDTNGDGLPNFTDVASAAGVADPTGIGHSCVFIDIDNDGDQDLFVTNWGGNKMFRNQLVETGSATFTDITTFSGLQNYGRAITSSWGDFNGDGYLDVYLAKHRYCPPDDQSLDFLYMNNGDGSFTDVSGWLCPGGTSPCPQLNGNGFMAGWFDYDNDGDPDLYLINDFITTHAWPNVLWRNDGPDGAGGWSFTDVSVGSGADLAVNGMGLGVGDYDNDGWLDVAFSNEGPNKLLRNNGDGTFDDVSAAAGIERSTTPDGDLSVTWGTVFFDYDNDRWLDLFITAGQIGGQGVSQPDIFFRNNRDGTFEDVSVASGTDDTLRGRCVSIADFDNDGFVDLFVGNVNRVDLGITAPFRLFHNRSRELGSTSHWLTITAEGTVSNRDAIGTRFYLTTPDGMTQIREMTSGPSYGGGDYRAAFFGLEGYTTAELTIRWPNGVVQTVGTVSADQNLHFVEPGGTTFAVRINAGGTDYTTGDGRVFTGDKLYTPGEFGYSGGRGKTFAGEITGTDEDNLYQTVRSLTGTFSYIFDNIPGGLYDVTFHFMEPSINGPGVRLFDVVVEGSTVLDDYDIFASAGARLAATQATVQSIVADGQLNISFVSQPNRNALVSAIEVVLSNDSHVTVSDIPDQTVALPQASFLPLSLDEYVFDPDHPDSIMTWTVQGAGALSVVIDENRVATITVVDSQWTGSETITFVATDPLGLSDSDTARFTVTGLTGYTARMNAGGPDFTDAQGNMFSADRAYVTGDFGYIGGVSKAYTNAIANTEDDPLYQAIRYLTGSFSYQFDNVPAGDYEIILYFIEPSAAAIGARVNDVLVEGVVMLDNYDIFANAGALFSAVSETLVTTVSDGQLTVTMESANNRHALISAISVAQISGQAASLLRSPVASDLVDAASMPHEFSLMGNFPNPFNPSTEIRYALKADVQVKLSIYNILGEQVATLVDGLQKAGFQSVRWNGTDGNGIAVASGVYLYRLTANGFVSTRKMILSK